MKGQNVWFCNKEWVFIIMSGQCKCIVNRHFLYVCFISNYMPYGKCNRKWKKGGKSFKIHGFTKKSNGRNKCTIFPEAICVISKLQKFMWYWPFVIKIFCIYVKIILLFSSQKQNKSHFQVTETNDLLMIWDSKDFIL